jgi:hypothetical protein
MTRGSSTRGILVLANETADSHVVHEAIRLGLRALGPSAVTIVAPALNSRARHWTSDEQAARGAAELRLARSIDHLARAGIYAEGWVGDADPLLAVADALAQVPVDLAIVATHPEEKANWLARGLAQRVRRQFALPVLHVVVDRERRQRRLYDVAGAASLEAQPAEAA